MSLPRDIAKELAGMFLADARLTISILALVLIVAGLNVAFGVEQLIGGGILLVGCHLVLVEAALRQARHKNRP